MLLKWAWLSLVLIFLLGAIGCDRVTLTPRISPTPKTLEIPGTFSALPPDEDDVAITAIDFDPPLKPYIDIGKTDITLLSVVENKGSKAQANVKIVAQIYGADNELLIKKEGEISKLAAGESRVVRLAGFSSLPLRPVYSLVVTIVPLPDELAIANNSVTYQLRLALSAP